MEQKEPWYKTTLIIIAFLLFFFPIGLFLMWKYAKWSNTAKWIVTALVPLLIIPGALNDKSKQSSNNQSDISTEIKSTIASTAAPTVTAQEYQQLSYEDLKTVENYTFLYTGQDKTEKYLEKLVRDIKAAQCTKPCNINLFDDKKAADLDLEMKSIKNEIAEKEWKRKNYIYVADHFLAYLEFEGDGLFLYYPYKDWAYDELKK